MAKNTQQRSEKAAEKREKVGEKELRHRVRPGIHQAMDRIRTRSGTEEISEVIQLAILKMDAMTDAELIEFLKPPRHEITISKTLRDKFDNESRREAGHHGDDSEYEVVEPNRLPHGPDECAKAQLDILSQ
ncbi:hypothetical protein D3C81_1521710 [compost metagenome]